MGVGKKLIVWLLALVLGIAIIVVARSATNNWVSDSFASRHLLHQIIEDFVNNQEIWQQVALMRKFPPDYVDPNRSTYVDGPLSVTISNMPYNPKPVSYKVSFNKDNTLEIAVSGISGTASGKKLFHKAIQSIFDSVAIEEARKSLPELSCEICFSNDTTLIVESNKTTIIQVMDEYGQIHTKSVSPKLYWIVELISLVLALTLFICLISLGYHLKNIDKVSFQFIRKIWYKKDKVEEGSNLEGDDGNVPEEEQGEDT